MSGPRHGPAFGRAKISCRAEEVANLPSSIAPDLSRAVEVATPVFLSAPKRRYADEATRTHGSKSGADCTISHGSILGAPRFSP
jgi:hypothetical protein